MIKSFTGTKDVIEAITERGNEKDWYMLKYDVKTTEYNNDIVFKTLDEANEEWKKTKPSYPDERIELIFAPTQDDPKFKDNVLVKYKMLD